MVTNITPGEVRQAIVIGLGNLGSRVLQRTAERLNTIYQGVPTIKLLTLGWGEAPIRTVETDLDRTVMHIDLSFTLADLQEDTARFKKFVEPWLPEDLPGSEEELARTRLSGRLALFQHVDSIDRQLRSMVSKIIDVSNRSELEEKRLRVKGETALDVYVAAALDEPFASGLFLDLSYLILDTLKHELPERIFCQLSELLFLPRIHNEDAEGTSPAEQREAEVVRRATTYAALKELDYYTDKQRYECIYHEGIAISASTPPFTHACYLIDSVNEKTKGVPNQHEMATLVGEWLYQMLATPLQDNFQEQGVQYANIRSHGKVATYSGLGLSAYFLPIEEAIDTCAVRLGTEIVRDYLLLSISLKNAQTLTTDFVMPPQYVEEQIRDDRNWQEKLSTALNVPDDHFAHIPLYDLTKFEGTIRRLFINYRYNRLRPRLQRSMADNARKLVNKTRKDLKQRIDHMLDTQPVGGVSRALRFLDQFKDYLIEQDQKMQREAKLARSHLGEIEREIRQAQARYISAVRMVEWPSLLGLSTGMVLVLWILIYAEIIFLDRLEMIPFIQDPLPLYLAGGLALFGHLAILGLAGYYTYRWFQQSRMDYISSHRRKLKQGLEIAERDAAVQYYRHAQDAVSDQIANVTQFRDDLESVAELLEEELERPRPLYGTPHFVLEESVLEADDLDLFYKEVTGKKLTDEIAELFEKHGPFHTWQEMGPEEIQDRLLTFSRQKMGILRQLKSAEEMLVQHAARHAVESQNLSGTRLIDKPSTIDLASSDTKREVRRRLERLRDNSLPFLPYNSLELGVKVTPRLVQTIGVADSQAQSSLVNKVLEELGLSKTTTGDRHTITGMSVRHGLPLSAIGTLRICKMQYQFEQSQQRRQLHTRRAHLALPDIFPVLVEDEEILDPQAATALGLALRKINQREDGQYTFRCKSDLGETVEVEMGTDKVAVSIYLQRTVRILRLVSEQIDQEVVNRSRRSKRGNQVVIDFLRRYMKKHELEDWEQVVIEEYARRLAK